MTNISILGAGSWGTALSVMLAKKGFEIKLWDRNEERLSETFRMRENKAYLPGVKIPDNVVPCTDIHDCIENAEIITIGVPSHAVREVCRKIKDDVNEKQTIVSIAKGIENDSFLRMSQVIESELKNSDVCVLSGPSHAEEVSQGIPTTVVSSSRKKKAAEYIQDIFMTPNFRIYTNPDIVGVELGGAVKNIIALAAGISDGLGYGDNTKAALMTRGINEMARLGEALGADTFTFAGLSGIGDLIVTCTSIHSRNRRAGILIGQGKTVEQATSEIKMVVEGIKTASAVYELSKKYNVEMPICDQLYEILFKGKNPRRAVQDLMTREKAAEMQRGEEIVHKEHKTWEA